ncbi:hypothetical protein L596_022239 [Steinernema carpocapsae]|nr:hypothetical protein L596_022239 [Steinernema carpocapsae]
MLMHFGMTQSQAMIAMIIIMVGGAPISFLAPWLIERLGRRPLILAVSGLCIGEWFLLGSAQFVADRLHIALMSEILGVVGSILGQAANMLGLLTLTAILISEMCPHTARAAITQIAQILPIVFAMGTVLVFQTATESIGFFFYIPMLILSIALFYAAFKMIPETKGLPVDEIMHKISRVAHTQPVRSESSEQLVRPSRYGSVDSAASYDEINE